VPRWRVCGGRQRLDTGRLEYWETGRWYGTIGAIAVLAMSHSSPSSPQLRLSLSFFGARLPCEKSRHSHHGHRASDRLASARADPGGRVLQREDICTVGGTALGLVQGARSGPLERLMFCRLQLLAVNYSMSRGGFGGLVASGRVLSSATASPVRRHGIMGWDGTWSRGS
jgi:hypothetical protein